MNNNFSTGHMSINILPPIPTAGLKKENIDTLMNTTYDIMNRQYKIVTENMLKNVKSRKSD